METITARIAADDKAAFDALCSSAGLNPSTAINLFVKTVLREKRIPFALTPTVPVLAGSLTKEQFDSELQKGMDDIAAGRVLSADEVEAEMRKLYGE